jgi:penicillin-binding protein 1A
VVFEAPAPVAFDEAKRAVPARNVFITNSLLQEVTRSGTAARAQKELQRTDLYGKTGTTNDAVDAWFAGFQPSVVGVAWMGYDTPRSLGARESGGGLALPIWIGHMRTALKGVPVQPDPLPPIDGSVVQRNGDWVYSEYAEGNDVESIGLPQGVVEKALAPVKDWFEQMVSGGKAASSPP